MVRTPSFVSLSHKGGVKYDRFSVLLGRVGGVRKGREAAEHRRASEAAGSLEVLDGPSDRAAV